MKIRIEKPCTKIIPGKPKWGLSKWTTTVVKTLRHLDGPAIRNANRGDSHESIRANRLAEKNLFLRFRIPGIELKNPSSPEIRKKIRKSHEIPHSGSGPENTKKIQKKYENGSKMTVFVFFLYFFCIFGARPGVGDRISGLEGFFELKTRNAESQPYFHNVRAIRANLRFSQFFSSPKRDSQKRGSVDRKMQSSSLFVGLIF